MANSAVLREQATAQRRRLADVHAPDSPMTLGAGDDAFPALDAVRRWLRMLGEPDRIVDPELAELLRLSGRLPTGAGSLEVGRAAIALLTEAIERRNPAHTGNWRDQTSYQVLRSRFIEGVTSRTTASRLGISTRQLSRDIGRSIELVRAELQSMLGDLASEEAAGEADQTGYRFEPIPALASFVARPWITRQIGEELRQHHVIHVHGPAGIGKTSLLAELALNWSPSRPVLWYHLRAGVNDTLGAVLFELGQHLRSLGRPHLAEVTTASLPRMDVAVVSRVAVAELSEYAGVLVVDDYHLAEADPALGRFLDDLTTRLPELRVVTVGRYEGPRLRKARSIEMPALTLEETTQMLQALAATDDTTLAMQTHEWTGGIPQLVALAAPWLATATADEITGGLAALRVHESVQAFLLDWLTGLMDSYDRDVLEAASVFRDPFTDVALAALTGRTLGQISDVCRRLVRYHIASRGRSDDVAFVHTSIRDYIYERLSSERRQLLHERAAEWYRTEGNDREVAYHPRATE